MLERKIAKRLERFYEKKERKALLITGARQVGKTFIIEQFAKKYRHYVRINFIENPSAALLFENASPTSGEQPHPVCPHTATLGQEVSEGTVVREAKKTSGTLQ